MKKNIITLMILLVALCAHSRDIYVATTGSDSNDGNINNPYLTIEKALEEVQPGETIYVRGGTYQPTKRIKIPQKETSAEKRICLWGYPGEQVIIDGSRMTPSSTAEFKMSRCIYVDHNANYWHFKNLEMCNAPDNGMKIEGSYNIVENCKFYDNNDTGLQIGMYKDYTYEETKNLPKGTPEFNPDYQFCKNNIVINCDSYYNYDAKAYGGGSDDGGDADGFACKLFPGPGTEFIGCRAWNNSDDNWDLYMVYHPVKIDNCWAWKAGYDKDGIERKNGNGFKLGGGGTSGGAAFAQSVGTHLVTNCISFDNLHKGFDQNNAYEGMYLFNNVAWGNEYNYRFPTEFKYGTMYMRNNIGWGATASKNVGNHEFLSEGKEGYKLPDTDFNSWTTIDGCDPIKEGNKVNGTKVYTQNHAGDFKDLTIASAKAPRQADGSLPDNDFARLKEGSKFIDAGQNIVDFVLARFMKEGEANGLELITLPDITIPYNDEKADMGAYETGIPTMATMKLISGSIDQLVYIEDDITPIVYTWGQAATGISVEGLIDGLTATTDESKKTLTISGSPNASGVITLKSQGGTNEVTATITIAVSTIAPGTLICSTNNSTQTINIGTAINDIVFVLGGGATSFHISTLPEGLTHRIVGNELTISGTPTANGSYTVTAKGGMLDVSLNGSITRVVPTIVLTGDWYPIQDAFDNLPGDLQEVVSLIPNGNTDHPTRWSPEYTESNGTVPSGCTKGAVEMGRNGGGIQWKLPSLAELKGNVHFTGKRKLSIQWSIDGGAEQTWTSSELSATTLLNYDLMAAAGIQPTTQPITIKFTNAQGSGEIRLYDFYVRIYDPKADTGVANEPTDELSFYRTETALIVQGEEIAMIRLFNSAGSAVSCSVASQVVDTSAIQSGIYIVQVITKQGKVIAKKMVL